MAKVQLKVNLNMSPAAINRLIAEKKKEINEGVKEWIMASGDILISNTPVSTAQFANNWSFYVGAPRASFRPDPAYYALRGAARKNKGPAPEIVRDKVRRRLRADVKRSKFNVFDGDTVVGFYNPAPYGKYLERGISSQAPYGIVGVTVKQIKSGKDVSHYIERRL